MPSPLKRIDHPFATAAGIKWYVKQDNLYGPGGQYLPFQGNKVRKLKGHLQYWKVLNDPNLPILSFGGAFSNHLLALAAAGRLYGIPTIGVVRGESVVNPVLAACQNYGMHLHFISRGQYRRKHLTEEREHYQRQFGPCLIIPEGGSGPESKKGTTEILPEVQEQLGRPVDFFQLAAGTGGTAAGVIESASGKTRVEVYPVLKGGWMKAEIEGQLDQDHQQWKIIDGYHFGGYAKRPLALLDFCARFSGQYQIPLEPIYTAKLFYGVLDRIRSGLYSNGITLVTYHSGGIYEARPT